MIDVLPSIVSILRNVPGFHSRVYRKWPAKDTKLPYCVVGRVSTTVPVSDHDGSEVIAYLTYSVDINADSFTNTDKLAEDAVNALAGFNIHRTGDTELYDDSARIYRRILTVSVAVDRRGNTFKE